MKLMYAILVSLLLFCSCNKDGDANPLPEYGMTEYEEFVGNWNWLSSNDGGFVGRAYTPDSIGVIVLTLTRSRAYRITRDEVEVARGEYMIEEIKEGWREGQIVIDFVDMPIDLANSAVMSGEIKIFETEELGIFNGIAAQGTFFEKIE